MRNRLGNRYFMGSLIDRKYWYKLHSLKKCPKCGSGSFNIKTLIDVTTYYENGKKVKVTKSDGGSQNFHCEDCDLTMSELGFEE